MLRSCFLLAFALIAIVDSHAFQYDPREVSISGVQPETYYEDGNIAVVSNGQGTIIAVYSGGTKETGLFPTPVLSRFSTNRGKAWSNAVAITTNELYKTVAGRCMYINADVDSNCTAVAVWGHLRSELDKYALAYAVSTSCGVSWGAVQEVDVAFTQSGGAIAATVASSGTGVFIMVYSSWDNPSSSADFYVMRTNIISSGGIFPAPTKFVTAFAGEIPIIQNVWNSTTFVVVSKSNTDISRMAVWNSFDQGLTFTYQGHVDSSSAGASGSVYGQSFTDSSFICSKSNKTCAVAYTWTTTTTFSEYRVARSVDFGMTWTTTLVALNIYGGVGLNGCNNPGFGFNQENVWILTTKQGTYASLDDAITFQLVVPDQSPKKNPGTQRNTNQPIIAADVPGAKDFVVVSYNESQNTVFLLSSTTSPSSSPTRSPSSNPTTSLPSQMPSTAVPTLSPTPVPVDGLSPSDVATIIGAAVPATVAVLTPFLIWLYAKINGRLPWPVRKLKEAWCTGHAPIEPASRSLDLMSPEGEPNFKE